MFCKESPRRADNVSVNLPLFNLRVENKPPNLTVKRALLTIFTCICLISSCLLEGLESEFAFLLNEKKRLLIESYLDTFLFLNVDL